MTTSDPFIQSLTYKTSPGPYHQAIFLSQKTINKAFQNMWLLASPDDPIRVVDLKPRDGTSLKGVLNAPTVIVNVVDHNAELYFQWNFASGTMKLFESNDPTDPKMLSFDLTNWTVAYGTVLDNQVIPPTDPKYQGYVTQMGVPTASQFSISQLSLRAQENANYYAPGSSFSGTDWSKQTQFVQGQFATLRLMWSQLMEKTGQSNLAVTLTTDQPQTVNPGAPTFPPTSISYAVYPWKDPVNPMPANNDSDSNALAYLIMTSNEAAPVPPVIPYTGCWVDTDVASDPNRDAILCFKSSNFWETWLLPLVQIINRATQIQPTTPYFVPSGVGGCDVAPTYSPGTCTAHPEYTDPYYKFVSAGEGNGWTWTAQPDLLSTLDTIKSDAIWGATNWLLGQNSTANTSIKFDAGAGTFTVVGRNTVSMTLNSQWNYRGGDFNPSYPFDSTSSMDFTMSYTLKFAATRVDSGGVQILSIASPHVVKGDVNTKHSRSSGWKEIPIFAKGLQDKAFATFQAQLGSYQNAFLSDLSGQHKLILPGAGAYLCNKVMFSKRGDFLVNLAFNGSNNETFGSVSNFLFSVSLDGNASIPGILMDSPPHQVPSSTPWVDTLPVPFRSLISKGFYVPKPHDKSNGKAITKICS